MKYTDLTKEQREHFDMLVSGLGEPPVGATHFDLDDTTGSSYMTYWSDDSLHYWSGRVWKTCRDHVFCESRLVPIPDKPWYDPKDVALTPKPKVRKIVYDRDAFNQAIKWILNNSPYAQEDWRNKLHLDVRRWMKDLIKRYDAGEIDGVSYISSAGLTLMSSWESDDVLHFDLFADVNVGADCGEYEYDVEGVF